MDGNELSKEDVAILEGYEARTAAEVMVRLLQHVECDRTLPLPDKRKFVGYIQGYTRECYHLSSHWDGLSRDKNHG